MSDALAPGAPLLVAGPDGRVLAAGLAWDAGPAAGGSAARAAAALALDPSCDHAVAAGGLVGAARLAGAFRCHALAVLALEGRPSGAEVWTLREGPDARYWVRAARDGRLSARADRVFPSREAALAHALALCDALGLGEPAVLDAAETRAAVAALADLPPSAWRAARLAPLRRLTPRRLALAGIGAAALLGLAGLGVRVRGERAADAARAERRSRRDGHAAQVREALAHPERRFAADFLRAPACGAFLAARAPALLERPLAAAGWVLERLEADGAGIRVTWALTPQASLLQPPRGAVLSERDLSRAVERVELPPVPARRPAATHHDLPGRLELTAWLTEVTRRLSLKMTLSWKPPAKTAVDGEQILCPWVAGELAWTRVPHGAVADWRTLASLFDRPLPGPGLVLTGLSWDRDGWSITGAVHARR